MRMTTPKKMKTTSPRKHNYYITTYLRYDCSRVLTLFSKIVSPHCHLERWPQYQHSLSIFTYQNLPAEIRNFPLSPVQTKLKLMLTNVQPGTAWPTRSLTVGSGPWAGRGKSAPPSALLSGSAASLTSYKEGEVDLKKRNIQLRLT